MEGFKGVMGVETYTQFLDRIDSFEVPRTYYGENYIYMNPNLSGKVEEDNSFKMFFGDTTVFDLDYETKQMINGIVDSFYETVPECFAQRLIPHTFHMTLHDLSNSPHLENIAQHLPRQALLHIHHSQRFLRIRPCRSYCNMSGIQGR